jgi:hypothetical protein
MCWSLLASGTRSPNSAVVQVALLVIILAVDVPLFAATSAASAPATLEPDQLLCCAAPLSLLFGWLCLATVLLLSNVAQLCGVTELSVASADQAAPCAAVVIVAMAAAWLLSPVGPFPGNFWVAGSLGWGLLGCAVSARSKPLLQYVAVGAVVLVFAAAAAGTEITEYPPKWGWASTGTLRLRAALAGFGGGGKKSKEATPLVAAKTAAP